MSEHTNLKSLAPLGNQPEPSANSAGVGPSKPFTEAQVEEFREQDRWLPVSIPMLSCSKYPVLRA